MPQQIFFVVLASISFISFIFCLFLRKPDCEEPPFPEKTASISSD